MITQTLQTATGTDPALLLKEIFDETSIPQMRYFNWQWFRSVMEYKVFNFMGAPAKLVAVWSQNVKMVHVADILWQQLASKAGTSNMEKPEDAASHSFLKDLDSLFHNYKGLVIHLSVAEANDPLLFLQRFFSCRNKNAWYELLDEWLEGGLSNIGLMEYSGAVDEMPEALELLQGLCEACWLLYQKHKPDNEKEIKPGTIGEENEKDMVEPVNAVAATEEVQDKLTNVFEHTEIEYLHYDLWLWFRALFTEKAFDFRGDPSMLIYLHRHIGTLVSVAEEMLQKAAALPAGTPTTDRQRYYSWKSIFEAFDGRVTRLIFEETKEPVLFFRRFFAMKTASEWMALLDEWLEDALSLQSATAGIHADELPDCLEMLEGLCQACWLLHEAAPQKQEQRIATDIYHRIHTTDDNLEAIIEMICASMEVEKIFLLAKYPLKPAELGEEYDLLVIVNNPSNRPMDEFESLVRNRSEELQPVHATIMAGSKVKALLHDGNWFFHNCCSPGNLVYEANSSPLTIHSKPAAPSVTDMEATHQHMLQKARQFLEGASRYAETGESALAVFMLHQAMEHAINAILSPLMQYRPKIHNLAKLLRLLGRFSPELHDVFPRDTEFEQALFRSLQQAYIHARYKDSYTVNEDCCTALMHRVKMFIEKTPAEFSRLSAMVASTGELFSSIPNPSHEKVAGA